MIARFILLAALVVGAIFAGMTNPMGTIAFGTGYDDGTSSIQGPGTVFPVSGVISWLGHFNRTPGTTTLIRRVIHSGPGGAKAVEGAISVSINDADASGIYANRTVNELEQELHIGPGTYTMQYLAGSTILAEGTFTLTQ